MDGSLSTGSFRSSSIDSLRADSLRFDAQRGDSLGADVSGGLSSSSVQGNLFEQILSLPAPISVDRHSESLDTHSSDPPDDTVEPTAGPDSAAENASSETEDEPKETDDTPPSVVIAASQVANEAEVLHEAADVGPEATPDETAPHVGDTEVAQDSLELKPAAAADPDSGNEQNSNELTSQTVAEASNVDSSAGSTEDAVLNQAQETSDQEPQETSKESTAAQNELNTAATEEASGLNRLQQQQETAEGPTDRPLEEQTTTQATETNQREGRHSEGKREEGKWYEKDASTSSEPQRSDESYAENLKPISAEQRQTSEQLLPSAEATTAAKLVESISTPDQVFAASTTTTTTTVSSILPEAAAASTSTTLDGDAANIASPSSSGKVERNATRDASKATQPNQPSSPDELTQHERIRLVQRVARSFARLGPTGGQINLRLHPPQLGSLNVQVRLEGRSMTAKLTTETSAARDAILESLPVLRGRLAEQGYEVSQFQVEVADNNADANFGQNNEQAAQDSRRDAQASQVDYRRLALGRSQTNEERPSNTNPTLIWQATAGIDVHA